MASRAAGRSGRRRPSGSRYGSRRSRGARTPGLLEILAAAVLCTALAAAVTWPLAVRPGAGAHDPTDTFFNTWLMAWNHEALTHFENPLAPPVFEGQPDAGGRNDLLLTQSLAAMPLRFAGLSPLAAHNLILVASLAFAGFALFLLAGQLGTPAPGALFAAGAFVCLPFFQSHLWHIQLFSAGIAVMALRQAVRIAQGERGAPWLGALVALQCMASLYYALFLGLALLLFLPWAARSGGWKALLRVSLWTLAGFAAVIPLLLTHFGHAARWPVATVASTDVSALVSPWENSMLLGRFRPSTTLGEVAFWPGLAVVAGTAAWLFRRNRKDRLPFGWFLAALALLFLAVSLGPTLVLFGKPVAPAPWRLLAGLPAFSSIRLPSRAAFLFILPAILAAGRAVSRKPGLAALGIALCLAEVWPGPMNLVDAGLERFHGWLAARSFARIAILPMEADLESPVAECSNLLGQTVHFTPMVNGYSTSLPEGYARTAAVLKTWPSPEADSLLDALGVECIICRGFIPPEADPVWGTGPKKLCAVVLGRNPAAP